MTGGRGYPTPDPRQPRGVIVGSIVLADGTQLKVTAHCVDRFWERAATGCTQFRSALARLQALARAIGIEEARPGWAGPSRAGERWIALGPEIGLVAARSAAVTCLVRGQDGRATARRRRRRKGR